MRFGSVSVSVPVLVLGCIWGSGGVVVEDGACGWGWGVKSVEKSGVGSAVCRIADVDGTVVVDVIFVLRLKGGPGERFGFG